MSRPVPARTIEQIIKLRESGLSYQAIGEKLGINSETARRHCLKSGVSKDIKGGTTIVQKGVVEDDHQISLIKDGKIRNAEGLMELYGLSPEEWIASHFTGNLWGPVGKPNVQSKAVFKRKIGAELKQAIEEFVRRKVQPLPKKALPKLPKKSGRTEFLVTFGLYDAHIGLHAWGEEVGQDYDLKIAEKRVCECVDQMAQELSLYNIAKIIIPFGNDWLHTDGPRNTTTFSDHTLDVDTRFLKVYKMGLVCAFYLVERAFEICNNVEVLAIPGNHDFGSTFTIAACIEQRYRNEPGITVDLGPTTRKYREWGGTALCFDHGKIKPSKYPIIFSEEAREMFAKSTYREVHIGHTHQKKEEKFYGLQPMNGVLIRTMPALTSIDFWHYQNAFIGHIPGAEAQRYDRAGLRGTHTIWVDTN